MFRRSAAVTLLAVLTITAAVQAHRLEAEATVRPFGIVQVESWFETGDTPKSATVEVFRSDGRLLTSGRLNEQGIFTFSYPDTDPLRIVVNAGVGHRAEVQVKSIDLKLSSMVSRDIQTWLACATPEPSPYLAAALYGNVHPEGALTPPPERRTGPQYSNLALGLGILLLIGGGTMILRKARMRATATNKP
jgi:nickel transport protein